MKTDFVLPLIFDGLKKRGSKIRKFFLRLLLFFLLFIGLLTLLLRNKAVQTNLAKRAATYLSKELNAKVSIGSIELDFFRNAHIENVYFEDQQGDSMLYAGVIDCNIDDFSTTRRIVWLRFLNVANADIQIGKHKGMDENNIDFLVRYFNPPRKKKRTTPKKIWSIFFEKVDLSNSNFAFYNEEQAPPVPGILDQYHLQFKQIQGKFENFWLVDDSLNFLCNQLSCVERSGLQIQKFKANCIISDERMDFTNMLAETQCSVLQNELHFKYPGYKKMGDFIHNTYWNGKLEKSKICLKELSIFNEMLRNHPESIEIENAQVLGTFDNILLKNTEAKFGKNSHISGNFSLAGLPSWRNTDIHFELSHLQTNHLDLQAILNGYALPSQMTSMGQMSFTGNLAGRFLNFESTGKLQSALGELDVTKLNINLTNNLENSTIAADIHSGNFNLAPWTDNKVGLANFNLQIYGNGFTPKSFKAEVKGEVSSILVGNTNYRIQNINTNLTSESLEGKALVTDANGIVDFDGKINFGNSNSGLRMNTHLEKFNLTNYGLPGPQTLLTADVISDLNSLNLNKMSGKLILSNILIHKNNQIYSYDKLDLEKTIVNGLSNLEIGGDILSGNVKGSLDWNHIADIFQNIVAPIFPSQIKPSNFVGKDSLRFNLTVYQSNFFNTFISDKLWLSEFTARGYINSITQKFGLKTDKIKEIKYGDYSLKNFKIRADKPNNIFLNFYLDTADLYDQSGELLVKNIKLKSMAQPNFADLKLTLESAQQPVKANLIANVSLSGDSIPVAFSTTEISKIQLGNQTFSIDSNSVMVFQGDKIFCRNIQLKNENKDSLLVQGVIGNTLNDNLHVGFSGISFSHITSFIPNWNKQPKILQEMQANFQGNAVLSAITGDLEFDAKSLQASDILFDKKQWGTIQVKSKQKSKFTDPLLFSANFANSALQGNSLEGKIQFNNAKEMFDFNMKIPAKKLAKTDTLVYLLNPFLKDIIYIQQAKISGEIRAHGNPDDYALDGKIRVDSGKMRVDYLNTWYQFDSAYFDLSKNEIVTRQKIRVLDETQKGHAYAYMKLNHQNFNQSKIKVAITDATDLKCLNTSEGMNDIFFGQGYANGSCYISGPFDKIDMDIKLETRPGTNIKLLYSDVEENKQAGFIRFTDKEKKDTTSINKESSSIHRINIEIKATPDALAEFIIDPYTRDIISGRGAGVLKMLYDENQNFTLSGKYIIQSGMYSFSIPYLNIIQQKLTIQEGGTLEWTGDPFDCVLNVTGYVKETISPTILMASASNEVQTKTYPQTDFYGYLNMTGNLFSPKITFDLDAPKIKTATDATNQEVWAKIQAIKNNPDIMSQQVMALIITGNFIGISTISAANGITVLGNSFTGTISNLINKSPLGKLATFEINLNQVNSGSSNSNYFQAVNIGAQRDFYKFTLKGSYNLASPNTYNAEAIYNFKNPNYSFKVFSRPSNLLLQSSTGNNINTFSQVGQTFGLGLGWRKEFEKIWNKKIPKT